MQFHLNGYETGDPLVEHPRPSVAERAPGLPEEVDVLIVGCGPAGLVLAAQLATFPELSTVIVERRDGPLEVGQADGVACRTVEMFEAFGLADAAARARPTGSTRRRSGGPTPTTPTRIVRTGRVQDVEDGLSEFPHVIVNQARMQEYLLEYMRNARRRGWRRTTASSSRASRSAARASIRSRSRCGARATAARRRSSARATSSGATARAARVRERDRRRAARRRGRTTPGA